MRARLGKRPNMKGALKAFNRETEEMRNGHHHQQKRMRGRNRSNNNNNNRGHNPLTRVYESNGPDVKIRGTAHHIAEKYIQLARDSQSSGDPVSSEGYLQHAEHYFRLIAAAQAQFAQQNPNQPQQVYQRPDMDGGDEDGEGEEGSPQGDSNAQPYAGGQPVQQMQPQPQPRPQQQNHNQPQPSFNNNQSQPQGGSLPAFITGGAPQPNNGYDNNEQGGDNRGNRNDRNNRYGRNRNRNFRQGGNQGDNQQQPQNAAPSAAAPEQPQTDAPAPTPERTPE